MIIFIAVKFSKIVIFILNQKFVSKKILRISIFSLKKVTDSQNQSNVKESNLYGLFSDDFTDDY